MREAYFFYTQIKVKSFMSMSPLSSSSLLNSHTLLNSPKKGDPTTQATKPIESTEEQLRWLSQLQNAFTENPSEKKALLDLWNKGVLNDATTDDPHSTLYYLNKRLQEPCLPGLDPRKTVAETLNLLADSSRLTQQISPLNKNHQPLMMAGYLNPDYTIYHQQALSVPKSVDEIQLSQVNSCSVLSEIGRLVDTHPQKVARMIYEASNPTQDIHETVNANELFPDAPILAEQVLKDLNLEYHILDDPETLKTNAPTRFQVSFPIPNIGVIRAMNAQEINDPHTASGAELLLEEALLYNFSAKSYDAGRDTRDSLALSSAKINNAASLKREDKQALNKIMNQSPRRPDIAKTEVKTYLEGLQSVNSKERQAIEESLEVPSTGLTQEEQLMMERILEDHIPLENVTYQQVGQLEAYPHNQDKTHVLLGYTKSFTGIKQDLLTGLASPLGQILANVIEPNEKGAFEKGHVVRILGSRSSPLKIPRLNSTDFLVQDTSKPTASRENSLQWWHESQLIPRIHHITERQSDAERAWQSMSPVTAENPYGLLNTDKANDAHYTLNFLTHPPDQNQVIETPEAFHRRLHEYRHKQANQITEDLKSKRGGPSQSKTESNPVLWGEAHHV